MASLIPGYNYDIFISYRQKDNKYDGWVTKFVDNLKKELEATFKEDISVYFDENPHDRLQETYDVDRSLESKLKCLIFIPILSQTYCDPNSYAWQHEFLAFLQMVRNDRFGKDVKLRSGNVASRVLPIRIHDLEPEDVKLFEKETGSMLRVMDFVFKTGTGAIRPLLPNEDHPNDNLYKTYYRDQISKVAIAIKEIIVGMKIEPVKADIKQDQPEKSGTETKEEEQIVSKKKSIKAVNVKSIITISIVLLLIIAGIVVSPRIFKRDSLEKLRASDGRITIAVMPFQNMTNDTIWDTWQVGIQDEFINALSAAEELNPRQAQIITSLLRRKGQTNYKSITPSLASNISRELDANVVVCGTIKGASTLRINVNLADSKTENILKSFSTEGPAKEDSIFTYIDTLSKQVRNFLVMSKLSEGKALPKYISTSSPEAYKYLIKGTEISKTSLANSVPWFKKALEIDSNYFTAIQRISVAYRGSGERELGNKYAKKAYQLRDQLIPYNKLMAEWNYAQFFETPNEEIIALEQILEIDDQIPDTYFLLGIAYGGLQQYEKAIPAYERALELSNRFGLKPYLLNYNSLGGAYLRVKQYEKAKEICEKGLQDYPDNLTMIQRQASISLIEGDIVAANRYIERVKSLMNDPSPASIASGMGNIYREAGLLDSAEVCMRRALSLTPNNPSRIHSLAYLLIDNDRNINEGLELEDRALKLSPDNYTYLHWKGWGLYKQGKYQEALEILQRSWDIRREKSVYSDEAFIHLEAAKKAVAGMK